MKKQYGIMFLIALFFDSGARGDAPQKDKKTMVGKAQKKKAKKAQLAKQKEITPYELAQNISIAINYLIKHKDEMTDVEPLLRKRRDISVDIYRAEGYCVLTMADACFPSKKGKDIFALMNWSNIHPLLGKDTYSDGVKKFIDLNMIYNNDSYYKAAQSEIARDKIREIVHENFFSIIDVLNKIGDFLPGRFYYSGHPYEGVAPLNHIALYEALSDTRKVTLSSFDVCYHKWQVALYRNLFLLLKLIAKRVEEGGMAKNKVMNDEDKGVLRDIAKREVGDDTIVLPSGLCAPDKNFLEKIKLKPEDDTFKSLEVKAKDATEDVAGDAEKTASTVL